MGWSHLKQAVDGRSLKSKLRVFFQRALEVNFKQMEGWKRSARRSERSKRGTDGRGGKCGVEEQPQQKQTVSVRISSGCLNELRNRLKLCSLLP